MSGDRIEQAIDPPEAAAMVALAQQSFDDDDNDYDFISGPDLPTLSEEIREQLRMPSATLKNEAQNFPSRFCASISKLQTSIASQRLPVRETAVQSEIDKGQDVSAAASVMTTDLQEPYGIPLHEAADFTTSTKQTSKPVVRPYANSRNTN